MSSTTDPEKTEGLPTSSPPSIRSSSDSITSAPSEDQDTSSEKKTARSLVQEEEEEEEDNSELHHDALVPTVSITTAAQPTGDTNAAAGQEAAGRSRSRASTTRSRALTIVPRSQRRGVLARLALVPEAERPYEYKNSTKWGITLTIALATAAAPLGSSIFYPALPEMTKSLHTTEDIANLSVALYMISMSIFPLWWSSFSEQFGRRSIYIISFALFLVFAVLSAVSTNIAMLIVFRILTGGASASVQAVGAGTIADIWESRERGRAMSTFYLGPLLAPLIAPIVGGALAQGFGWKATMWFLAIYGLAILLLLVFCLPETLARRPKVEQQEEEEEVEENPAPESSIRRMTTAESAKVRTRNLAASAKRIFIDPLSVLLFLRFPPVFITVFTAAIAFGALFISNISIQQKFSQPPYNFSEIIIGLMYIPAGLGYFVASILGGRWIDKIMARQAIKANRYDENGKLIYLPEDRFRENMWLANTMYPIGLLIYGWTLNYGVIFIVPAIGSFIFGAASMLVFSAATTMLTEFVRKKSSAGVAVNNFVRNILSCVGVIVAAPWINAVGVGWVFTTVALFCMVAGFIGIWTLRRNAARWRKQMDEALKDY
ncbi:dityrosine transporter, required for spore wall synthesis [Trichoderma parareesei]|uniref:Dityrosine transporter, required for spore wall synthesis n=1 Tax=Trichoderma parareesei TaxID=858221 RepID=A0A2H2ZCT5_TRIPA|nr:dityrosine transporter, required for spore wall synthesis [Trichoderma parareesei]